MSSKSARRVRRLREAAGLSVEQLATAVGCSVSFVRAVEYRQKPITPALAGRLAVVFGIDVDELLG